MAILKIEVHQCFVQVHNWCFRWLVGCFGFYGPLRQYFSLYRAVSQREGERGERIDESKNVHTTPTRTYCKRNRPLPYCNQNCRTPPGTGSLHNTMAPSDHPVVLPPAQNSHSREVVLNIPPDELNAFIDATYFKTSASLDSFKAKGSGWVLDEIIHLEQIILKYRPLRGECSGFSWLVVLGLMAFETVFQSISGRHPKSGRKRRDRID